MTYSGNLSYKNSPPTVTAVQQLLLGFQLCQTQKKKREGDADKKVEVHAPVSLTPISLSRYISECRSLPKYLLPFPSPVIPLNPHLIPSQVLGINEINNIYN